MSSHEGKQENHGVVNGFSSRMDHEKYAQVGRQAKKQIADLFHGHLLEKLYVIVM